MEFILTIPILLFGSLGLIDARSTFPAETSITITSAWLYSDGTSAWWNDYTEGDTAILRCRGQEEVLRHPFDIIQIRWMKYGSSDWEVIANHESIVYFDGRNRFSRPNLTVSSENETEYSMAIGPVDRYDNGNRFRCEFGFTDGHSVAMGREMKVKWSPPSPICSTSIPLDSNVERGDVLSYYCTVIDTDTNSLGSLALWNDDVKFDAAQTKTRLTSGFEYNITHLTTMPEDRPHDEYVCRYSATGGFEDYRSNCTFKLLDPSSGAADPRRSMLASCAIGLLMSGIVNAWTLR